MDCQLLAASLQRAKGHCRVVGTASSVAEARRTLKQQHPDVALVSPHLAEGPLAGFDLVQEMRDSVRSAIREAHVKIEINGNPMTLVSGNYRLPVTVGGAQAQPPSVLTETLS